MQDSSGEGEMKRKKRLGMQEGLFGERSADEVERAEQGEACE